MASKTKKQNIKLSFRPAQIVKKLLGVLDDRGKDVLVERYGLETEKGKTLEAIGKKYGITRERVRQIENNALSLIRKSDAYEKNRVVFEEMRDAVDDMGAIISEPELLEAFSTNVKTQNQIYFLLVVGEFFYRSKEDSEFRHRWFIDQQVSESIHDSLRKLYKNIGDDDLIPESDMIQQFLDYLEDINEKYKNEEILRRWLLLSKKIGCNPLGEWGRASSTNVNAKGIRDYSYLVLRKHGSPIHFREVAHAIEKYFDKKAHEATTHNELIKDPRFVLVGRGLYALSEWGYATGVVKDVIENIIETNGPMTKEEIIDRVKKERYVKDNTILVNLQNTNYFRKDSDGLYHNVVK